MCYSQVAGRTKSAEAGENTQSINMFYTQPIPSIHVQGTSPEVNRTQVMAVDKQTSDARFVIGFARAKFQRSSASETSTNLALNRGGVGKTRNL